MGWGRRDREEQCPVERNGGSPTEYASPGVKRIKQELKHLCPEFILFFSENEKMLPLIILAIGIITSAVYGCLCRWIENKFA